MYVLSLFSPFGASLVSESISGFRKYAGLTKVLQVEFLPIVKNRVFLSVEHRWTQPFPFGIAFQKVAWEHLIAPSKGP